MTSYPSLSSARHRIAQGYAADGVRQQFTAKERDVETGLDYFGVRYYASVQGRFTGADPYDINFERQETDDAEKADNLFEDFVDQPQHWNHYVYALNNPIKFIDPDGRYEYDTEFLGKKIKVKISDNIDKKEREGIKKNLDAAIEKINKGADKLSSEHVKAINSLKGIEVRNDVRFSFMHPNSRICLRYSRSCAHEWFTTSAARRHERLVVMGR